MLGKKRENKAKAEMTGRLDKVSQAQEEVQEVCNLIWYIINRWQVVNVQAAPIAGPCGANTNNLT